ncbi:HAD family hydrolase [Shouchella sp. 1P09AA]|uniref:HAD family hydrolase n=1 Tax=unclassified Shouchella TaxID=2893065 RepID=UPI0039A11A7A
MIKAVFFDLDDTLLWDKKSIALAFRQTCLHASIEKNVDPNQLEVFVRQAARTLYEGYDIYPFTVNIGINPFEGLWGEFRDEGREFAALREVAPHYQREAWYEGLQKLGVYDEAFALELAHLFPIERRKHPVVYDDTFSTLNALKDNVQLVLITNGSPDLQNTKLELTPELVPYFDHILISGAFGQGKPKVRMFEEALSRLEIAPNETLMVGDNLHTDILGANASDIPSVWLNRDRVLNNTDSKPTFEIHSLQDLLELENLKQSLANQ